MKRKIGDARFDAANVPKGFAVPRIVGVVRLAADHRFQNHRGAAALIPDAPRDPDVHHPVVRRPEKLRRGGQGDDRRSAVLHLRQGGLVIAPPATVGHHQGDVVHAQGANQIQAGSPSEEELSRLAEVLVPVVGNDVVVRSRARIGIPGSRSVQVDLGSGG